MLWPERKQNMHSASKGTGGPFMKILRNTSSIKFPPNWEGELPPPATREELRAQMVEWFRQSNYSEAQIEKALDFFEQYEMRYYEVVGKGQNYHRPCGGGAMVEEVNGIFCAKCGKLPNLFPPEFMC